MRAARVLVLASALCLLCAQAALAGAPLKGIDVKLGKNPGGGCAARISAADQCAGARATDAAGEVSSGVLPKGDYVLNVSPPAGTAAVDVQVAGPVGGPIESDVAARSEPITFQLDGSTPLVVSITTAKVKSHSNVNNN